MIIATPPPVPKPREPLVKSVATSLTSSDNGRLVAKLAELRITKAAYVRALILADLNK